MSEIRSDNALRKLDRMAKALRHEEPDRVPISDFFWGGFIRRWRAELGLPAEADIYRHYDLDWIVTTPNMDPWIRPFQTLSETPDEVVIKTGFGAVINKRFEVPMPEMRTWDIDSFAKLERRQPDRGRRRRLPAEFSALD
jgi:uroporphyrinogen decarboxylase